MIQTFINRRYFLPDELTALFMADAVAPHRTFDQGNSKVLDMIRNILEGVADRIRNNEQLHFTMPAGAGGATEAGCRT